jgi:hypothetical protein
VAACTLIGLMLVAHLGAVFVNAWFGPPWANMPACYHNADPTYPEFVVASDGGGIFSIFPLGVNCIYYSVASGALLGTRGPSDWGPTVDAGITLLLLLILLGGAAILAVRRRQTPTSPSEMEGSRVQGIDQH